jgi:Ras-related GTP-binding protein A/B
MSYLEKEMQQEDFVAKELDKGDFGHKLLFIGLAQTGKSSIIKVVFEGVKPEDTSEILATVRYKRKLIDFSGYSLNVYDVGGQITYLEEAFVALRESIFSHLKTLFFVVDSSKVNELEEAKNYLKRALSNTKEYSRDAQITVLAHKMDLIPEEKRESTFQKIIDYFEIDTYDNVNAFSTSIFEESIFKAIEETLI